MGGRLRRALAAAPLVLLLGPHLVTVVAAVLTAWRAGATASAVDGVTPTGLSEARRTVASIPSIRRLFHAVPLLAAAFYGLDAVTAALGRDGSALDGASNGVVVAVTEVGALLGVVAATVLLHEGARSTLRALTAAIGGFGASLLLVAVAPWTSIALAGAVGAGAGRAVTVVSLHRLLTLLLPPRVRGIGLLTATTWIGPGLLGAPIARAMADGGSSYAAILPLLAVLAVALGLIALVHGSVDGDVRALAESRAAPADTAGAVLAVRNLEAGYDGVQILFGVDVTVGAGEIVALLGTNGAGKSTLLSAVSGLVDPTGGSVWFDGRDITHVDARTSAKLGLIQMPGGRSVFPTMTVAEHYRLASWLVPDGDHVEQATAETRELFPRLAERWDQLAGNLSGGEQQMLGLSMALVSRPKLLMIDELSLGLAPAVVETLIEVVRRIHANGTAIVLVEQSVNVALTIAERAYFLEKGEVRFSGPTAELLERDDILRAVFLAERPARTRPRAETRSAPSTEPVLVAEGLVKHFGGILAVDGVGLTLHRGEILGLIGPNGAGKTTVFDLLSGFLEPDEGTVVLDGADVTRWSPDRRARAGLGRSFQDARLVPSCTVAENLALGLERHLVHRDHVAHAFALPHVRVQEANVAWTVDDLVELMGLGAFRHKLAAELSTGSRRIVDLAMCIGHHPSALILDEPSSGIAQREAEALVPLLRRIQDETGCSMLLIEHDMQLITAVSDRMLALEVGRVIAEGTPTEVTSDPRVVSSYLGTSQTAINRSTVRKPAGARS